MLDIVCVSILVLNEGSFI